MWCRWVRLTHPRNVPAMMPAARPADWARGLLLSRPTARIRPTRRARRESYAGCRKLGWSHLLCWRSCQGEMPKKRASCGGSNVCADRPPFGAAVGCSVAVVSWLVAGRRAIASAAKGKDSLHSAEQVPPSQVAWLVDHPLTLDAASALLMHGKFLALAPRTVLSSRRPPQHGATFGPAPDPPAAAAFNCRTRAANYLYVHVMRRRSEDTVVSASCARE
jgi:hypothetical protein